MDPAWLMWWIVQDESNERLEAVARVASPPVERLLRDSLALHWVKFQVATRHWRELPENWRTITPAIYHEMLAEQYRIDLEIIKFNDETVKLTCEPDSLVALVSTLVRTLTPLASANPFAAARLDELRAELDTFWAALEANKAATDGEPRDGALEATQ
jgi:hypothetical protein